MECKFAYMKQNIDYVLCRKEPEPTRYDKDKLFHAVCAHQVHCPKENCHKLSAGWQNCVKLREAPQSASAETSSEGVQTPDLVQKQVRKSRKRANTEE